MASEIVLRPADYGTVIGSLLAPADLRPPLDAGTKHVAMADPLLALTPDNVTGQQPTDRGAAACCLAGLWLWHNYLDEAHMVCQSQETPSGNSWHAIMHRREADFDNAKYWFRRAGDHPAHARIARFAAALRDSHPEIAAAEWPLRSGRWDPCRFVDWTRDVVGSDSPAVPICRELARAEWIALFDSCYHRAVGRDAIGRE